MDTALFHAINSGMAGPVTDWVMVTVSNKYNWIIPILLLVAGMIYVNPKYGIMAVISAGLAVAAGDMFTFYVLKPFFARPRPCITFPEAHVLMGCVNSFSLPSNHAVNSLAVAGALGWIFRPLLWWLVPAGLLVCLSRVAVGAHYPLDVTVGAILGFCIGISSAMIVKRIWGER
ncbi:Lipoprotein signal peptidase [hydrothermal vent metagenome]|uniref:Lipoprotein signal peptidase n=1 Tax=hydrothermal vent metagenome TaxID=652676 RepID=A0A3B1CEA2_9ZZZZ